MSPWSHCERQDPGIDSQDSVQTPRTVFRLPGQCSDSQDSVLVMGHGGAGGGGVVVGYNYAL